MKKQAPFPFLLIALFLISATGCPTPELTLEPGADLFEVQTVEEKRLQPQVLIEASLLELTLNPFVADFFFPGSDPFDGVVELQGVELGTSQVVPGDIGNTAVIIERTQAANLPEINSQAQVPIELVALSLSGVDPFIVTYNGGQDPEPWDLLLTLSPTPAAPGFMFINRQDNTGGTLNGQLPVNLRLTVTRVSDGAVRIKDHSETLVISQALWSTATREVNWPEQGTSNMVPGLSKIPGLGNLFKKEQVRMEGPELLLLITPTLVRDDTGD